VSNTAQKARDRRRLEKAGGKRLDAVTINDFATWLEILEDQGVLPSWVKANPTTDAIRVATETLIANCCRQFRKEKAEEMLSSIATARTGLIARESAPDPAELPALFSTRFSAGGRDWSFKPGGKKDKGRRLTDEEIEEFLEQRADLEGFTEAEVSQEHGVRIVGGEED
jgi:hypothetical protein